MAENTKIKEKSGPDVQMATKMLEIARESSDKSLYAKHTYTTKQQYDEICEQIDQAICESEKKWKMEQKQ